MRQDKVDTNIDTTKFFKDTFVDRINICSIIPANLVGLDLLMIYGRSYNVYSFHTYGEIDRYIR